MDNDFKKGLNYLLTGGSQYARGVKYQLEYQILCDKGVETFELAEVTLEDNKYTVSGRSQYGCPIMQVSSLLSFIEEYKYLFGILLLLMGGVVCFYGFRLLIPVLFIFGYMTGFLFVMLIFGEFILSQQVTQLLLFICILIAIIIGSIIGYVFIKLPRIAYTVVGVWLAIVTLFHHLRSAASCSTLSFSVTSSWASRTCCSTSVC